MIEISASEWNVQFDEALTHGSVTDMVEALQSQATAHAGTAPAKVKQTAIKMIQQRYKSEHEDLFRFGLGLCQSGNATAEEVGAQLLATCYEINPATVASVLQELADSPHWEVREWVAGACGVVLERQFDHFYPMMASWANDESENVRRAVTLAVMYAGKNRNPEFSDP